MKRVLLIMLMVLGIGLILPYALQAQEDVHPGKTEWDHGIMFWKSDDGAFSGCFDIRAFLNGAYFFENKNE